jgi:hypothetical protein
VTGPVYKLIGILGWVGIALIVLGVVVSLVPVDNPGVQACGAPVAYLVSGELDRIPDADGRVERNGEVVTLDAAARKRAVDTPCSERIARRAIPAGVLVVVGSILGLTAVIIGIVGAWRRASARASSDIEELQER